MKKLLAIIFASLALSALFVGCQSDDSSSNRRGPKPRRETSGGSLPWARPADWEGGLPGMGSLNNGPRNY